MTALDSVRTPARVEQQAEESGGEWSVEEYGVEFVPGTAQKVQQNSTSMILPKGDGFKLTSSIAELAQGRVAGLTSMSLEP
jgi:hypothetical protein